MLSLSSLCRPYDTTRNFLFAVYVVWDPDDVLMMRTVQLLVHQLHPT